MLQSNTRYLGNDSAPSAEEEMRVCSLPRLHRLRSGATPSLAPEFNTYDPRSFALSLLLSQSLPEL